MPIQPFKLTVISMITLAPIGVVPPYVGEHNFVWIYLISLQYPKSYFMVVAIGAANDFMSQLSKLATTDSHGKKMIFGLKDFKNFAHVAYYFHKGTSVGACPLSVKKLLCLEAP